MSGVVQTELQDRDSVPLLEKWLCANGFTPGLPLACNAAGDPALVLACRQKRGDIAALLLALGAPLNAVDRYGNNALWAACYAEDPACIAMLLEAGIDIDYRNPAGATALIYVSSSGKHRIVQQLLDAGADSTLKTQDDLTALDLAATVQCLKLLRCSSAIGSI
ncbi:MAG: ankyrin repeat domain-containing protein [Gammaproteobacteria bacterium]